MPPGETGLPVSFEPEFMTTTQARNSHEMAPMGRGQQGKHAMIDASAAALILQSYLDKKSTRSIRDDEDEDN